MPHALFSRRLIFVIGKGGVGRTTVAQALAIAAATRGMRTLVADLEPGEIDDPAEPPQTSTSYIPSTREGPADGTTTVISGVEQLSIDPQAAMEEYLTLKLPGSAAALLRHSRLFGAFALATPGMREMLCMGKLWELAQLQRRTPQAAPYDLVIVDAPASGHGVALLRTPRTFAGLTRVGPIADQAQRIAATLTDPAFTAVVSVCTPQELAVNETLMVRDALSCAPGPMDLQAVILNGIHPDRFTEAEVSELEPDAGDPSVALALIAARRAAMERAQEARLADAFADRLLRLPYLFRELLDVSDLQLLATALSP
ncbi:MAG: ArsA family ATPase [Solirubrobacteraceae bacterium]